jgi:sugar phosphate permease
MTKWQIFVEYVLKNKVIWLLCFSNIFLYVVRIGIDQWSTVYAFQELKLSKEVAIQGFTLLKWARWSARCCGAGSRISPMAVARWWPASRWR